MTVPVPGMNHDTKAFWEACREHRLSFQKCDVCGHVRWPAGRFCPQCGSGEYHMEELSGNGTVYSCITFHRAFHPAFADAVPYVVAAVDLDEGPRILSALTGCAPEAARCNMRVRVAWRDTGDATLPVFEPEKEATA